jgi:hypothetical protein
MTVTFKTDILPLFTSIDIEHMRKFGVSLDDYEYMSQPTHAESVYETVSAGTMPPKSSGEPPWPEDQVQMFKAWMDGGYQP